MIKLGTYESWFDSEPIVPGDTLPEVLRNLASYGYQGIQFGGRFRDLGWDEIGSMIKDSGIQVCIAGGGGNLLSKDPDLRRQGVAAVKDGLRLAAKMGAVGSICVPIRRPEMDPPAPPKTLYDLQEEILIEELKEIAPVAEGEGVMLIIEPLNRYESQFIQRLDQAYKVCAAVASPNIRFMADFFHMNIEEVDLGKAIEATKDYLGYVHLADSNRYEPGAGHLDFAPGLSALKRIGYDGFMTLECRILGADKGKALTDAAALIRSLWDEL
ncbi:MAG: sugar phosphate isomerase/epimerase [Chloroflexi bacterium]|nr:sugar phosphate isomerase/epimerase [Chloroflexota bacterium]